MRFYRRSKKGAYHCAMKLEKGGRLFRFSTRETDLIKAQMKALDLVKELKNKDKVEKISALPIWKEDLLKFKRSRPDLDLKVICDEYVKGFSLEDYQEFKDRIIERFNSNSTINKKLLVFQQFIKYIIENLGRKYALPCKFKLLKIEQSSHYIYKNEQLDEILDHFKSRGDILMHDLILILRYTGMRLNEALTLESNNLQNGFIHLYKTKNNRSRAIPVSTMIRDLLPNFVENVSELGSVSCVSKRYSRAKKELDLPNEANLHAFRHTFAQNMVDSGQPIDVVSKLLGHSSLNVTLIYAKTTDERLVKAIESI